MTKLFSEAIYTTQTCDCGSKKVVCMHESSVPPDQEIYDEYRHVCLDCRIVSSEIIKTSSNENYYVPDCPFCDYHWQKFTLDSLS